MSEERENQLSHHIDEDHDHVRMLPDDPELAAMAATVRRIRSARNFEPASPDFAERGWKHILQETGTSAGMSNFRRSRTRTHTKARRWSWLAAAVSVIAAAVLLTGQWMSGPTVSAAEIHVKSSGLVADLGIKEVLYPRYAGSLDMISYGSGDHIQLWKRSGVLPEPFLSGFNYSRDISWHPGGSQAVFSGYRSAKSEQTPPSIWLTGPDGRNPKELAKPADPDTSFESPVFSPNGQRIAFTSVKASLSDETGVVYKRTIMIMDADGSNLMAVTEGSRPAWSRDGGQLVYTTGETSGQPEIWLADQDGKNALKLGDGDMAAWSPTHPFIVYTKNRTEHRTLRTDPSGKETFSADVTYRELWALNVESGSENRLTAAEYPLKQIDALLAESERRGETTAVYTVSGMTSDEEPSWSPDGMRILFTRNINEENGPHYSLHELFIEYR